jgi:beta-galactosidase
MNADIWINGEHAGNHPYGYTSFWYDLTDKIKFGEENILAVQVKNEGLNSRWYSGSGIYRHVWLKMPDPVYTEPWGIFISTPEVNDSQARVNVKTEINNKTTDVASVKLITRIINIKGVEVARAESEQQIPSNGRNEINQQLTVNAPELWSIESPVLYTAITEVHDNGRLTDQKETKFGIRTILFDAAKGFLLNGKSVKMKGGCVHHDNGILGAVAIDRAEERRIELLKANGFNAVRCAHNPPSPAFLDACDRLGMIVIDEAFDQWQKPKNPYDYHLYFDEWWERDISSMVLRDRNHPSILFWSLGNEIQERAQPSGIEIMKKFKTLIGKLDDTRPFTLAVCEFWDNKGLDWSFTAPAFEQVDIGGYNYQWEQYESDHEKFPQRIMMGTESVAVQAFQNWQMVEKHPYVIGDFIWTAMDYLGETGIGHTGCEGEKYEQLMPYPWFNANCGDIDLIGNKKPQSFFRDVVWRRSKIELAVHAPLPEGCKETVSFWGWPDEEQSWTWPEHEGEKFKVNVYSRSELVRLELNGEIIGEKQISDSSLLTATFEVPYKPGELKAIALENGNQVATVSLITAGKPAGIRMKPDKVEIKTGKNDLSFVSVEVIDEKGNVVPDATIPVEFSVSGNGKIIAAGNANPSGVESFQDMMSNTFSGRCLVILQREKSAGYIELTARAQGLKPVKIIVKTKK